MKAELLALADVILSGTEHAAERVEPVTGLPAGEVSGAGLGLPGRFSRQPELGQLFSGPVQLADALEAGKSDRGGQQAD